MPGSSTFCSTVRMDFLYHCSGSGPCTRTARAIAMTRYMGMSPSSYLEVQVVFLFLQELDNERVARPVRNGTVCDGNRSAGISGTTLYVVRHVGGVTEELDF